MKNAFILRLRFLMNRSQNRSPKVTVLRFPICYAAPATAPAAVPAIHSTAFDIIKMVRVCLYIPSVTYEECVATRSINTNFNAAKSIKPFVSYSRGNNLATLRCHVLPVRITLNEPNLTIIRKS